MLVWCLFCSQIEPGSSSHTKIRIPYKGLKHKNGFGFGHHYVHLKIEVPKYPSRRQKRLIEEFARTDTAAQESETDCEYDCMNLVLLKLYRAFRFNTQHKPLFFSHSKVLIPKCT